MSASVSSSSPAASSTTRIESWAVAALGVVDRYGSPLLLRTYTSPEHVLRSPDAPLQAHLLVTPEDIVKLHFLLFSSIDRCNELLETHREVLRNTSRAAAAAAKASATAEASSSGAQARAAVGPSPSVVPRQLNAYQLPLETPTFTSGRQGNTRGASSSSTAMSANSSDPRFVGKLIQGHRFTSYGLVSASGIRTLLVTVGAGEAPLDAVVPLCRTIYETASAALCNPLRTSSMCWRMQGELAALRRDAYVEAAKQLPLSLPACRAAQSAGSPVAQRGPAGLPSSTATAAGADAQDGDALSPSDVVAEAEAVWLQAAALQPSTLDRARRLQLPAGTTEMGWCGEVHPGVLRRGSGRQEPTLAYSKLLHDQLESLLPPFTATARSCIIH